MVTKQITILIIQILHILVILYVLMGPFIQEPLNMFLYLLIIPFLVLHWVFNNNSCALTIMEAKMRNIPLDQGFIYRVITPIFKINHLKLSTAIYMVTIFLWIWVVIKMIIVLSNWEQYKKRKQQDN